MERRWLVDQIPSDEALHSQGAEPVAIVQWYLPDGRRLRRRERDGAVEWLVTRKRRAAHGVNDELEYAVSRRTAQRLRPLADRRLEKTRWLLAAPHGLVWEVDVIPESTLGQVCIAELELPGRDWLEREIQLPAFLGSTREITAEARFRNGALALPTRLIG